MHAVLVQWLHYVCMGVISVEYGSCTTDVLEFRQRRAQMCFLMLDLLHPVRRLPHYVPSTLSTIHSFGLPHFLIHCQEPRQREALHRDPSQHPGPV